MLLFCCFILMSIPLTFAGNSRASPGATSARRIKYIDIGSIQYKAGGYLQYKT